MVTAKAPITSMKEIKEEIEDLKSQKFVDVKMILKLLDYIESKEKLEKDLLINMNAVENHLVRVTELLQKIPQVNIGLLADALQAQIPKLDEIAYNTRKMVDYLELAVDVEGDTEEASKPAESKKSEKKKDSKVEEESNESLDSKEQLEKIEEQNKALIDALNKLSDKMKTGSE